MQKTEIIKDKSLVKSLNIINNLLAKSLNVSSHIILIDENHDNNSKNEETLKNISLKAIIKDEFLNTKEITSSNRHLFKGVDPNIQSITISPIVSSTGSLLGHLVLLHVKERILSIDEKSLLTNFADTISYTLEKHSEREQLQVVFADFLHKAIHDLKNPLTSISLTAELLNRKADNPKMILNLSDRLEKASKKLFTNLEELKLVFPIEDDKSFKLSITEINLNALLDDVKNSSPAINIQIKNHSSLIIYGDYPRLKKAFMQFLADFNSTTITIEIYSKENNVAVKATTEKNNNNYSAAFIIAKLLVEMHKGKVEIQDGSSTIYLPLATL